MQHKEAIDELERRGVEVVQQRSRRHEAEEALSVREKELATASAEATEVTTHCSAWMGVIHRWSHTQPLPLINATGITRVPESTSGREPTLTCKEDFQFQPRGQFRPCCDLTVTSRGYSACCAQAKEQLAEVSSAAELTVRYAVYYV